MDGVLLVDKPEGLTSHDVVAAVRRTLGVREVGHTGTLDPMATGVLVLVVGRATRLAPFFTAHDKAYDATVRLGLETDTWDRTGTVVGGPVPVEDLPAPPAIEPCLRGFLGTRDQAPPPFSAKKVGGVRAHVLARQGRPVDVRPVPVVLHDVEVAGVSLPLVDIRLRCSPGYYVRALAHELGSRLGCGACLERLRRTEAGGFPVGNAVGLDVLERDPDAAAGRVLPLDGLLPHLPAVRLDEAGVRRAAHGNEIRVGPETEGVGEARAVRLLSPDGTLLAIARPGSGPGLLHPAIVLK